jgi:hypothetical protein
MLNPVRFQGQIKEIDLIGRQKSFLRKYLGQIGLLVRTRQAQNLRIQSDPELEWVLFDFLVIFFSDICYKPVKKVTVFVQLSSACTFFMTKCRL